MQQETYFFSTMSNLGTERAQKPLCSMAGQAIGHFLFKRMNMCIDRICDDSPKSTLRPE